MGWLGCEITMTDGAWRVNDEGWDERCCCAAGEARAGQWLRRVGVLTAKRGGEGHAHAVSGVAR
jgi:hypothetical protein